MVDQGDEDKKYNAICNLMRRLPPSKFKECISGCLEFVEDEDLQDRICESIDTYIVCVLVKCVCTENDRWICIVLYGKRS